MKTSRIGALVAVMLALPATAWAQGGLLTFVTLKVLPA